MDTPEIVPEKLQNPINYRILIIIISAAVIFQLFLFYFPESETADTSVYVVSIINPLAASIASFFVAKRYQGTKVFGRAYTSLGLAYLMVFLAEITYVIYEEFLSLDPYPSIADVFFFALYPLTLIHLILNIRFFKPSIGKTTKTWLVGLPIVIIITYTLTSYQEFGEASFDFYYGIIFIVGSAVTLGFAVFGASIFRSGLLGTAWLVLVLGILANTIGDVWYYYLEVFGEYSLSHPVNLFWYTSYWIVVYALLKHRHSI